MAVQKILNSGPPVLINNSICSRITLDEIENATVNISSTWSRQQLNTDKSTTVHAAG